MQKNRTFHTYIACMLLSVLILYIPFLGYHVSIEYSSLETVPISQDGFFSLDLFDSPSARNSFMSVEDAFSEIWIRAVFSTAHAGNEYIFYHMERPHLILYLYMISATFFYIFSPVRKALLITLMKDGAK